MVNIIVFLIIVGVVLYFVNSVAPIVGWIKTLINCIAVIFVMIYLLNAFGYHVSLPR